MASRPKISIRDRAAARVCPNCGKPSPARKSNRGPAPLYCDNDGACKRAMANRNLTDGAALVPYLKAWRIDRGSGEIASKSFERICRIVDELNEADRNADRPRADYYAATLLHSNHQPVNELRHGRRIVEHVRAQKAAANPAPEPVEEPAAPEPQPIDLAEILRMIADGHNDPRALAEAALAARG
jgi:hypothetical protein